MTCRFVGSGWAGLERRFQYAKRLAGAALLLPVCAILAGCPGNEPQVKTVYISVPTYLPCQVEIPARPVWPDSYNSLHGVLPNGAVLVIGIDGKVEILIEGIKTRDTYIKAVETALDSCAEPNPH